MRLSISNIAWEADNDVYIYKIMQKLGFLGLEIAPTRIFAENPYENMNAAKKWAKNLKSEYGFSVPSMQSIWYGKKENIFASDDDRLKLISYTKKAIDFASSIGCSNLVFGCPKNRSISTENDKAVAISFFKKLGDYALAKHTVLAMEANPPIYNTNYINTTLEAIELIKKVNSNGFKLNLDIGTMIYNNEDISALSEYVKLINHVHISEPGLKVIEKRPIHKKLAALLKNNNYNGFVSIEMGRQQNIENIRQICEYVKEIFA